MQPWHPWVAGWQASWPEC